MLGNPQKLSSAQHTGTLWQTDHVSFHVCFTKLFVENTLNTLKYKTNTCLCKVWCESSGRLNRRAAAIPKPIFYLTNFRRTGQSGRTSWKLENRAFPDAVEFGNRTAQSPQQIHTHVIFCPFLISTASWHDWWAAVHAINIDKQILLFTPWHPSFTALTLYPRPFAGRSSTAMQRLCAQRSRAMNIDSLIGGSDSAGC